MAQKRLLSWVGFNAESQAGPSSQTVGEGLLHSGGLERIRELESQLADLRSRKDITSLTREEFEILATETAMTLVKTAQIREKNATSQAAKVLSESSRISQEAIAAAESKAKSILATAEARGRKYLEAAESESSEIKSQAERTARAVADAAKREASTIISAAKAEAEELVNQAIGSIGEYRNWLVSAVAESERLYKVQTQSLSAAQQAIEQSRQRLSHAFEKLASLTQEINESLDENNVPLIKDGAESAPKRSTEDTNVKKKAVAKKSTVKKTSVKKAADKKTTAKKSAPKKSTRK